MPDKIKDFYKAVESERIFKDEAEFRSLLKSNPNDVFTVFNSVESTKGVFKDYAEFQTSFDLVEKKNPSQSPTASSGQGVSTASSGDFYEKKFQENQNFLSKEVPNLVRQSDINQRKTISEKEKSQGKKNLVQKVTDPIIESLVGGTASVASGLAGLVGGTLGATVVKEKSKEPAPFLSNEWFAEKLTSQKVENPSMLSNQGISEKLMKFANATKKISEAESRIAKESMGISSPEKNTFELLRSGNIGDAGKSLVTEVIAQVPNIMVTALSGGTAGIATLGASAAGTEMVDMSEKNQGEPLSAEQIATATTTGMVEAISERLFGTSIVDAKTVLGALSSTQRRELVRGVGEGVKKIALAGGENGLEEVFVTTVNSIVKDHDKDNFLSKEWIEKVAAENAQSFIVGTATGTSLSALSTASAYKAFTKNETSQLNKFNEILQSPSVTPKAKEIAQRKVDEITKYGSTEQAKVFEQVNKLPL
jgi:hypothetical protein